VKSQITVSAQVSVYPLWQSRDCGGEGELHSPTARSHARDSLMLRPGARLSLALRYGGFQKPTTP